MIRDIVFGHLEIFFVSFYSLCSCVHIFSDTSCLWTGNSVDLGESFSGRSTPDSTVLRSPDTYIPSAVTNYEAISRQVAALRCEMDDMTDKIHVLSSRDQLDYLPPPPQFDASIFFENNSELNQLSLKRDSSRSSLKQANDLSLKAGGHLSSLSAETSHLSPIRKGQNRHPHVKYHPFSSPYPLSESDISLNLSSDPEFDPDLTERRRLQDLNWDYATDLGAALEYTPTNQEGARNNSNNYQSPASFIHSRSLIENQLKSLQFSDEFSEKISRYVLQQSYSVAQKNVATTASTTLAPHSTVQKMSSPTCNPSDSALSTSQKQDSTTSSPASTSSTISKISDGEVVSPELQLCEDCKLMSSCKNCGKQILNGNNNNNR